jgi:LmbE family N-acetylglucosaminyl deacetylase
VKITSVQELARYDCLFVSPHAGDAELSCVGRMSWEKDRGQTVLAVVAFGSPSAESETLARLGVDEIRLGLPAAPYRDPAYESFAMVLRGGQGNDAAPRGRLIEALDQIVHQTQARHIYLPLAIGGHVDHLITHEAAMQAIPEATGREIFFYEDRPYSFLPGSVWIRLGHLGARLPPAIQTAFRCGLTQYLIRFQLSAYVRAHATTLGDRLRSNGAAFKHWLDARGWHPRKACGPRLQPIEHPLAVAALEEARRLLHQQAQGGGLCTSRPREKPRRSSVPRLRRREESERYWLLLPELARDLTVPASLLAAELATPSTPARG